MFKPIKWLQDQAVSNELDPWLSHVADFSGVFVLGDSAGGNIVHHLAARLGLDLGLPSWHRFGYWRLCLPVGETSYHPLVNPFGPNSKSLEATKLDPILVVAPGSDLLKRQDRGLCKEAQGVG